MNNSNLLKGFLVYETWRRLCDLFYLNYKQRDDKFESFVSNEDHLHKEHIMYPNNELIEYFLLNSIKLINNYSLTAKANVNETVNLNFYFLTEIHFLSLFLSIYLFFL